MSLSVDGGVAAVTTPAGTTGYAARTGARRWSLPAPAGCAVTPTPGADHVAGGQVAVLADCGPSDRLVVADAATGRPRWSASLPVHRDTDGSTAYQLLSARPVLVDRRTYALVHGQRQTDTVLEYGGTGRLAVSFRVSAQDSAADTGSVFRTDNGPGRTVHDREGEVSGAFAAQPSRWTVVGHGLLVGLSTPRADAGATLVAFRLFDGTRARSVPVTDDVLALRPDGDRILVAESSNGIVLRTVAAADGKAVTVGRVSPATLVDVRSTVYAVGQRYVWVNATAVRPTPPVFAVRR